MLKFAEKMSGKYLMRFFDKMHKNTKLIQKFKLAKMRVKRSIEMFKNHCKKKQEAYDRLAMVFYEELEKVENWEQKIVVDSRGGIDFKLSENMDLYSTDYVNTVINRYIDYEFLDFSIKKISY
jgi:hypothetical protein